MRFINLTLLFLAIVLFSYQIEGKQKSVAKRIVALSPHAVEMLFAIGAGDKIIAALEYSDYPAEAKKIPRIGSYSGVQIEKLLALNPDLIIAWKSGNRAVDLAKMESLGLKVIYSQPKNISDINKDLLLFGDLSGHHDNAQRLVAQLKKRYHKITNRYQSLSKVSVFYQLWHDPLQSVGAGSWIESLINNCGGTNVFSHSDALYPVISLESVLVKNPQVIIIPGHPDSDPNQKEKQYIWNDWPEIDAVKNRDIYEIDGDLLHRFTPRALDGLELLCEKIDEARR